MLDLEDQAVMEDQAELLIMHHTEIFKQARKSNTNICDCCTISEVEVVMVLKYNW